MWEVLEAVGLAELIRNNPNGLDMEIDQAGDNFSVGEKQLFAVAR